MVAWTVKGFGGGIPRVEPRLLPDSSAEEAWNVDFAAGTLEGLPVPVVIKDLSATPGPVRRAYRLPGPSDSDPDAWLPLPHEFSSVCRSPLANDDKHRIYWTNPPGSPDPGPWWTTYARLVAGSPPYRLGFLEPSAITPTLTATGGTPPTDVPYVDRAYLFTYVDEYGLESSPSQPSPVVAGASDATWTVGNLPTAPPTSAMNYPPPVKMRIYRTITGASTGAQYYMVADKPFGTPTYVDVAPDTTVVNNLTLPSASWGNPPADLDGLISMPGGMIVGFTTNTVHFCEPDRPHAWPAAYDQSLQYEIVGMGVWQQSLVCLTQGFPSTGQGASPANFAFTTVQVPEPCIARGSIVTDLLGVYYASQNGLIVLNYFGMKNETLATFTQKLWTKDFHAADIIACRHRSQYLAINATGTGFLIDYAEPRLGVEHLNTFHDAVCVWNDPYNGTPYIAANKVIYIWDSTESAPLTYRWRSKQFYAPKPINMGACMVVCGTDILSPAPALVAPLLNTRDADLELPPGSNAILKVFAGKDGGKLVHTKRLTKQIEEFRLPSGFKEQVWQVEVTGRITVHQVTIAETMKELLHG